LRDGAHHVHGNQSAALRDFLRRADLAVERHQVRALDRRAVAQLVGVLHEVGMVAAQVDAGDRADAGCVRDGAGEPVGGNADAHAALDERQHGAAADMQSFGHGRRG
jgi:hypothetical protein